MNLIDQARTLPGCDPVERGEIYKEIQRITHEDVAYDWTFVPNIWQTATKRVQRLRADGVLGLLRLHSRHPQMDLGGVNSGLSVTQLCVGVAYWLAHAKGFAVCAFHIARGRLSETPLQVTPYWRIK